MARISIVDNILINDLSESSTFLAGDIVEVKPKSFVFAVQREVPTYLSNEGDFNAYPLFSKPIPKPVVYEEITVSIKNSNPFIKVRNVEVISLAVSSLIQVGSNQRIDAESRIKHIRQLLKKDGKPGGVQSVKIE